MCSKSIHSGRVIWVFVGRQAQKNLGCLLFVRFVIVATLMRGLYRWLILSIWLRVEVRGLRLISLIGLASSLGLDEVPKVPLGSNATYAGLFASSDLKIFRSATLRQKRRYEVDERAVGAISVERYYFDSWTVRSLRTDW